MNAALEYAAHGESLPIPDRMDWGAAPGQFKLYRGLPRTALGDDDLGRILLESNGITRQRWTSRNALRWIVSTRGGVNPWSDQLSMSTLRPIPSGGARFPGEVYVVAGPGQSVPAGVHYYDPAHHALVMLRDGDWTPSLARALGTPDRPSLTLLVSIYFWKNAFKYGELTYRLCGLDAGALIGQILETTADRTPAGLSYRFLDRELDALLGLAADRESVYAAVTLGSAAAVTPGSPAAVREAEPPVPPGIGQEEWSLAAYPLIQRLHHASTLDDLEPAATAVPEAPPYRKEVALPAARGRAIDGLWRRRSSLGYFRPATIGRQQLADLLGATAHRHDGDERQRVTPLFCAINDVEGIEPGVYRYDPGRHALVQVRAADVRGELQAAAKDSMFNLGHTGMCVYPAGDYERGLAAHGERWYRMQNMEAGILLQRLYLGAAAVGLSCQANLGYDASKTNALLGLEGTGLTSLIQIMIGTTSHPGDHYEHLCR